MIKLGCKSSALFLIILIFSPKLYASTVVLWGTSHGDGTTCSMQFENAMKGIEKNTLPAVQKIPNFIFAPENKSGLKSSQIVGTDDPVLSEYISLSAYSRVLFDNMWSDFINHQKIQSAATYSNYIKIFNYHLVNKTLFPGMAEISDKILNLKQNETYKGLIAGDLNTTRTNQYNPMQNGFFTILAQYFQNKTDGNFSSEVKLTLDAYENLTRQIATAYFNQKINSQKKYNIVVDLPNSLYRNQKIFDLAKASVLFANDKYLSSMTPEDFADYKPYMSKRRDYSYAVNIFWRNHFMAQNIINLIKANPQGNILVWFGYDHVQEISQIISKSKELSSMQKDIYVVSQLDNRSVACDLSKVLEAMTTRKGITPISEWIKKTPSR